MFLTVFIFIFLTFSTFSLLNSPPLETQGVVGASFDLGVALFDHHATGLEQEAITRIIEPSEVLSGSVRFPHSAGVVPPPRSASLLKSISGRAVHHFSQVVVVVEGREVHPVDVAMGEGHREAVKYVA